MGLCALRRYRQASPRAKQGGDLGDDKIVPLISKIAATSLAELERLIGELLEARTYLRSEGERIQGETARYTRLSQTASESVKIISDAVSEWRKAGHPLTPSTKREDNFASG